MEEKLNNYVKKNNGNGVRRLPPGFRFQPTEEELVFQYLKCKVFSLPLPASVIPHLNLSNFDPWDLAGKCDEEDRYLFRLKEAKYRNGNRMNRTTVSGYWKATGSDKKVSCSSRNNNYYYYKDHDEEYNNNNNNNNNIRGIRKTLVFFQGISPNGRKTDWTMHEYRLVTTDHDSNNNYIINKEIGDWVLCRIFLKKRNTTKNTADVADQPRLLYDLHSSMSSSCSSSSDHEESSAYTGF